jgi:hypothetical protein
VAQILHRGQQPFRRIALASKGIGPSVQGCSPGLGRAADGNHLQAGARITEQWQQGNTWQPGPFPIEQGQVGMHDLEPIQQAGTIDCLAQDLDAWLLFQQHSQRRTYHCLIIGQQDSHRQPQYVS